MVDERSEEKELDAGRPSPTSRKSERAATDLGKDQVAALELQDDDTRGLTFPSLAGEPKTEVSKRNIDSESGTQFVKQYVVVKKYWPGEAYMHEANIKNTREVMLHHGLRAAGDVTFLGEEDHPDGVSLILSYGGPVRPAIVDEETHLEGDYVLKQQIRDGSELDKLRDSGSDK